MKLFRLFIHLLRKIFLLSFHSNRLPMVTTYDDTIELVFQELDLKNDALEALLKAAYMAGAKSVVSGNVIDQTKGDLDVSGYLRGMKSLSKIIGQVNQTLTEGQAQAVKEAVNDLVDVSGQPLLTGALEQHFSNFLDLIRSGKELRAYADTLVDPNATPE